jgi:shikimate dehydrogenase
MTQIYGVIGHPIAHSLSPVMFNAAFFEYSMDARCEKFDVKPEELRKFMVPDVDKRHFSGLSVTIPHKETIIPLLDEIDETAREIGAVNTVKIVSRGSAGEKSARTKGFNTDWFGARKALEEVTSLDGKRVLVLGAGGAAAAIVYACRKAGATVTILNRTEEKAKHLADRFHCGYGVLSQILTHPAEVLVHTTSVGMTPNIGVSLVPREYFHKGMVVMDIVYNPLETRLVHEARMAGCRVVPGYKMLLYQAEKQFEIWFQKKPPTQKMEKALLEALGA